MRILLFFILLISFSSACFAQAINTSNLKFKTFTTAQGLPDNVVVKTVKDRHGFLWMATHNGIGRFDGKNFQDYTFQPDDPTSLRSIWVSDILIDNQQQLWATTEWGICYYNEKEDHFQYINKPSEIQLVFKIPMYSDTGYTIWVAAEDGLKKVDTRTKTFSTTALKRIPDPQFIIKDNNGRLVIGTRGKGVYRYDIAHDSYTMLSMPLLPSGTHFMDAVNSNGHLLICTDIGLLQLNTDGSYSLYNAAVQNLSLPKVEQLMCISRFGDSFGKDVFVCGTYNKKLFLFNEATHLFTEQFGSSNSNPDKFFPAVVYDLYDDKGILWIATDRGLSQVNLQNQQPHTYFMDGIWKEGNISLVKKAIADGREPDSKVWVIPQSPVGGVLLYDTRKEALIGEWNSQNTASTFLYNDLLRSHDGHTFFGLRQGAVDLFSSSKGLYKTFTVPGTALCAMEKAEGGLWIGTDAGLCELDLATGKTEQYSSSFTGTDLEKNSFGNGFQVFDIRQSATGMLWLACPKYGLFSFSIPEKKFIPHRQVVKEAFSTLNRCCAVEVTAPDSVWVGNMAGISCYIVSKDTFINYNFTNGLKSDYVYSLCGDGSGNLWGRGNRDIFYFDTKKYKAISTVLKSPYDALGYLQRISISGNHVLLGHDGGFSIFNTEQFISPGTELPRVQFTGCTANDKNIFFDKDSIGLMPLRLEHTENRISIDFTAIEYNYPDNIEYWYKLDKIEKDWNNAGARRSINYSNLPPGNYSFALFAKNKRNNLVSNISYFRFVISPAFWQHWWFWPLIALLFAITILFIAIRRVRAIRANEKQKTAINKAMAELETKMLRSQMNPHFIFNSLNSIQKYIWENKEEDAAEYLSSFAKLMRAILENSRRETITVQEEMNVMKLYIELEHRRSNAGFDYHIKTDEQLLDPPALIPPMIMQPFIENAIWHGLNKMSGKGNLDIRLFKKDDQLICIIDDDGVGIQSKPVAAVGGKSLGIAITRQRLEKIIESTGHSASVAIVNKNESSTDATGTIVTIILPLQTQQDA